eukprot:7244769-Prymnesium_polylepis.1
MLQTDAGRCKPGRVLRSTNGTDVTCHTACPNERSISGASAARAHLEAQWRRAQRAACPVELFVLRSAHTMVPGRRPKSTFTGGKCIHGWRVGPRRILSVPPDDPGTLHI